MNRLHAFKALIAGLWRQFQCEFRGHRLAHAQRLPRKPRLDYCVRCESPIYLRGLPEVPLDEREAMQVRKDYARSQVQPVRELPSFVRNQK